MKFYVFSKSSLEELPPIITLVTTLAKLNYEVTVITQNSKETTLSLLQKLNIQVCSLDNEYSKGSMRKKIIHWRNFRKYADKVYLKTSSEDLIWVSGADTAICMGKKTLFKRKFFFQMNELYDTNKFYRKMLSSIVPKAVQVIVPEINRAFISKVWYRLDRIPFVLPNKPFFNDIEEPDIIEKLKLNVPVEKINKAKASGKVILLYQGHIDFDRDFSPLLQFISGHTDKFFLVLMGYDHGILKHYQKILPDLLYVPSIPAPYHLLLTRLCDIGILTYLPVNLNNVFCAPNKIWEYTKYELVMIANRIPGLFFIDDYHLGYTFDFDNKKELETKLLDIYFHLDVFKSNTMQYYRSVDFENILKQIIDR